MGHLGCLASHWRVPVTVCQLQGAHLSLGHEIRLMCHSKTFNRALGVVCQIKLDRSHLTCPLATKAGLKYSWNGVTMSSCCNRGKNQIVTKMSEKGPFHILLIHSFIHSFHCGSWVPNIAFIWSMIMSCFCCVWLPPLYWVTQKIAPASKVRPIPNFLFNFYENLQRYTQSCCRWESQNTCMLIRRKID